MSLETEPGAPGNWLRRAFSNLIRARQPKPEGVYWEDLCFDAQQAAEKALKALLVARGVRFRHVHDIGELLTRVEEAGISMPHQVRQAAALSVYAVASRYPGLNETVTEDEYREAVDLAEVVVHWVDGLITGR